MSDCPLFPFDKVPSGKRIVIYGAGVIAGSFVAQLSALSYCEILFAVARNWESVKAIQDIPVYSPQKLADEAIDYDYIVVAAKEHFAKSIARDLTNYGIAMEKVIFSQNNYECGMQAAGSVASYPTSASPWGRISHSYHVEDLCVLFTFKALGVNKPSYIDVGAHHPYEASNTALMYKYGSRGINIEANPSLIEAFYKERPDDINLNIGVAPTSGVLPFYAIDEISACSTFSREECDLFLKDHPGCLVETFDIPVMKLDQVIDEHAGGVYPEFLSIDIEGLDYQVLSRCNFSERTPYIICVECGKQDTPLDKMCAMLQKKGYELYVVLADDAIFLKKGMRERLRIVL